MTDIYNWRGTMLSGGVISSKGPIFQLDDDGAVLETVGAIGEPVSNKWLLAAELYVTNGAIFYCKSVEAGGDCDELRIQSIDETDWYELRGHGGSLYFEDTVVTSWDTPNRAPQVRRCRAGLRPWHGSRKTWKPRLCTASSVFPLLRCSLLKFEGFANGHVCSSPVFCQDYRSQVVTQITRTLLWHKPTSSLSFVANRVSCSILFHPLDIASRAARSNVCLLSPPSSPLLYLWA